MPMNTFEEQMRYAATGAMYNDVTPELTDARTRTYFLTKEYNESYGQPQEVREAILRRFIRKIGKNVFFEPDFRCEFGCNITIGDNFYANFDCVMLDVGGIEIGDNVLFGPRVGIYSTRHAFDPLERAAGGCFAKPVKIGDYAWIGAGVHMDHGVSVGENAIVGAGSVITRDIPPNVVAAGSPCKIIRELKPDEKTDYFDILKTRYGTPAERP